MKTSLLRFILPVVTILGISSCVDPMYGAYGTTGGYRGGYNTYSTLPLNYSGSAYLYNSRYYSGGQYQTGSYNYQGRQYTNRYYHNGMYYYGGQHQNHTGSSQPQRYSGRVQDSHGRSNDQGYGASYNRTRHGSR